MSYKANLDCGKYRRSIVNVEEVLKEIERKYGDIDHEGGCYCNGRWMSVSDFVEIIISCAYPDD